MAVYIMFKEKAVEFAKQAVIEDEASNYDKALQLYLSALEYFKTYLKYEKNEKCKEAVVSKVKEYLARAEYLKGVSFFPPDPNRANDVSRPGEMSFTSLVQTGGGGSGGGTAAGSTSASAQGSHVSLAAMDGGAAAAATPPAAALQHGNTVVPSYGVPPPPGAPSLQQSSLGHNSSISRLSQPHSRSQSQARVSTSGTAPQTAQNPYSAVALAATSALYGTTAGLSPSPDPLGSQQHQQQQQQQLTGGSGMQPSPSSGSLAQYNVVQYDTAGVPLGAGSVRPPHGSLLMAGPGSLCAALPRYVRHPPIEAVVFGWGVTEDGQLGTVDGKGDVVAPKVVESLLGVQFSGRGFCRTPLVAGSRNTLALDAAGQVWSFGWNDRGTLGHGHRSRVHKPQRVAALKGIRVVQLAMGGWHCLALSDRGTMFAWGGNEYGQCGSVVPGQRDITEPLPVNLGLGPNQRVRQVSAGGMHSLALLEDGTVWQWGENWGDFSMHPVRTPRPVPGAVAVAAVSCGAFHNLLLTAGGRVLSWGMNDYGQLGNGSTTYSTAPWPVLDMDNVVVADIAAGGWHSCALSSAGEVWVWGRGEYGRLGLGDRSGSSKLRPQKVRGLESHVVVQVAAGGSHTMALTATARLFVWGRGAFGRLGMGGQLNGNGGNGTNSGAVAATVPEGSGNRDCYHPVECVLPGGTERWKVAAIAAGGRHSMCLAIPVRDTGGSMVTSPDSLDGEEDEPIGEEDEPSALPLPHALTANRHNHNSNGQINIDGNRHSSDEYDIDGYSEPSLYDKDLTYDAGAAAGEGPYLPRPRRRSTAASGLVTVDGAIAAFSGAGGGDVPYSSGGAGAYHGGGGGDGTAAAGAIGGGEGSAPDLRPIAQQRFSATSSSTFATAGATADPSASPAAVSSSPPAPAEPLIQVGSLHESAPPSRGSVSAESHPSSGGAPSSLPPPSVASAGSLSAATGAAAAAAASPSTAAAAQPIPPTSVVGGSSRRSISAASTSPAGSISGGACVAERPGPLSPAEPRSPSSPSAASASAAPRGPQQPLSPLPPAPPAVQYGMRRSGSAVGALSALAQILPEPAAVAAAALLDADSDLAPPRGFAAVAAAAAAAAAGGGGGGGLSLSTGASRPSSAHGSGGAVSRGGSVTGMLRFRTVFGGGGEDEDEATQAAEAAEAMADDDDGDGTGDEALAADMGAGDTLGAAEDDTDDDQSLYDGSVVSHPRSPSLMQRARSPPIPLSPRRLPSFSAATVPSLTLPPSAAVLIGSTHSQSLRGPLPSSSSTLLGAMGSGGLSAGAGGGYGGGGLSREAGGGGSTPPSSSPPSRTLLAASYGSPHVPSSVMQQQQ